MALSNDLLSQFAKAVNGKKSTDDESTVYGTTVKVKELQNGILVDRMYVRLDGADGNRLTPVSTTADLTEADERVAVRIKNHTATVTGNMSSPAARIGTVNELAGDIVTASKVIATEGVFKYLNAQNANIANLIADQATIESLVADEATITNLVADNAVIASLIAKKASITDLIAAKATIDLLIANNATIENLIADQATINNLIANKATIASLIAEKVSTEDLEANYANIDFANIGEAAIRKILADTGLITDLTIKDGKVTGELSAVEINGDLIKASTILADALKLKGADGLYYGLNLSALGPTVQELSPEEQAELQNGIHGKNIIAKSITADEIAVSDLSAITAYIAGMRLAEGMLYSGVKESPENTTQGFYFDRDGQMAVGDGDRFFRYYKDTDGTYKLEIAADTLRFGADKKTVTESIKIGARNLIRNSSNLIFEDYYFSGPFLATYEDGNITIVRGASAFAKEDGLVLVQTSATVSDDGNGNVTLV